MGSLIFPLHTQHAITDSISLTCSEFLAEEKRRKKKKKEGEGEGEGTLQENRRLREPRHQVTKAICRGSKREEKEGGFK